MASPQLENGFIRIAREIYQELPKTYIPSDVRRIIDFIILKTYGFNKPEDRIAISQFVKGTRLEKGHVCRAINRAKFFMFTVEW